jgi:hypothetical protein
MHSRLIPNDRSSVQFAISSNIVEGDWDFVARALREHAAGSDYDLLSAEEEFLHKRICLDASRAGSLIRPLDPATWASLQIRSTGTQEISADATQTLLSRGYPVPLLNFANRLAETVKRFRVQSDAALSRHGYLDPDGSLEIHFVRRRDDVYISSNWPEDEFWAIVVPAADFETGAVRFLRSFTHEIAKRVPRLFTWASAASLIDYLDDDELRGLPELGLQPNNAAIRVESPPVFDSPRVPARGAPFRIDFVLSPDAWMTWRLNYGSMRARQLSVREEWLAGLDLFRAPLQVASGTVPLFAPIAPFGELPRFPLVNLADILSWRLWDQGFAQAGDGNSFGWGITDDGVALTFSKREGMVRVDAGPTYLNGVWTTDQELEAGARALIAALVLGIERNAPEMMTWDVVQRINTYLHYPIDDS